MRIIRMRILIKLTLAFLMVSLLVLLVGYFSAHRSQEILQETIGNDSVMLAQNTMRDIDMYVHNRIEEFQIYSQELIIQKEVVKSNREFEKLNNIQKYISERDREWTNAPEGAVNHFMQELRQLISM